MLRRFERHITSKASPTSGTAPTTLSSATFPEHACDDVSGSTQLARLVHDVERHRCGDDITDARYEANQRIETEAHVDARQYEGGIEQSRQRV